MVEVRRTGCAMVVLLVVAWVWTRLSLQGVSVLRRVEADRAQVGETLREHGLAAPAPGWRYIAPDLRGFGGSGPLPGNRLPMDVLASDVLALMQHLGVPTFVVCGLSPSTAQPASSGTPRPAGVRSAGA